MTIPLPLDSVLLGFSNAGAVSGVFSYSCAVGCGSNSTQQSTETIELSRFKKTGVGNFIIIPTVTGPRADGLRLNSNDEFVVPETRSLVFTASSLTMAENSRLVFNPTLLLGSTHDLAFTQLIVDNATLARRTSIVVRFPVGFKPDLRRKHHCRGDCGRKHQRGNIANQVAVFVS
jgi:hypothetical protein